MKQKAERTIKKNFINFFGSCGYLLCFLQWFWVIMLYFSVIQSLSRLVTPNATGRQIEQSSGNALALPGSTGMIILVIVATVMVVITIYALIKLPMDIVKTGNSVVHKTAETMTPILIKAQHKKDTKKFRAKLTVKLIFAFKSLLLILPLLLTVASGWLEKQSIDYLIALIIGCGLACLGMAFFAVQYTLARLLHVKVSELW